jgi:YegS/Rv2252/BmrU family lipid kinase
MCRQILEDIMGGVEKMYYIIVNKMSGNGNGNKVWNKLKILLDKKKVPYQMQFTKRAGHASSIVQGLDFSELTAIIAVGGDGTIHEVGNELVHKNIALGIIPAGSGNDIARSLGIPHNVEDGLERIIKSSGKYIDVGKVGSGYFLAITGLGFDGKVAEVTNNSKVKKWLNKAKLGNLSYIINIFNVLFTYKPSNVSISVDGENREIEDVWLIAVANLPYYGGGIKICPEADSKDGLLDICIVSGISKWELLFVLPKAFNGNHIAHRHVTMLRGERVKIDPVEKLIVQCDGEIILTGDNKFSVIKEGLKIL